MIKFSQIKAYFYPQCFLWFGVSIVASLLLSVIEYLIALILQLFIYNIGQTSAPPPQWIPEGVVQYMDLKSIAVALVAIGVVRSSCLLLSAQATIYIQEIVNAMLRRRAIELVVFSSFSRKISASTVNTWISEIFPKAGVYAYNLGKLLVALIQLVAIAGFLVVSNWQLSIIGLLGIAGAGLITFRLNRFVRGYSSNIANHQKGLNHTLERIVRNWLMIKIYHAENIEIAHAASFIDKYQKSTVKSQWIVNSSVVVPPLLGLIVIAVMILGSISQATVDASIIGFMYMFIRFTQQLGAAASHLGAINSYSTHFERAVQLIDSENLVVKETPPTSLIASPSLGKEPPRIVLDSISFSWGATDKVFEKFSLVVNSGEQLAIVGESGSGKSTLLLLILGIIHPTSGRITIDGISPGEYLATYPHSIGYVGPDPYLFNGSIKANLLYGLADNSVADAELENALQDASVISEVKRLPDYLDYEISEAADNLSSGQKQRLALARALIRRPKILILDEATANLDKKSESSITSAINNLKKSCTVIIVSHRDAAITYASQVVDLQSV